MRRADEAGQLVDVAVGVVAYDAAAEPEHFLRAAVVGRYCSTSARDSCGLRFGLSRHCSVVSIVPLAVAVDRAPFEHDAGREAAAAGEPRHVRAARRCPDRTADTCRPRRCTPNRPAPAAIGRADQEHRPVIAGPDVVGRNVVQRDVRHVADQRAGLRPSPLRRRPECAPARTRPACAPARPKRRESARTCRARSRACAARPARWRRAAPTRRASDNRAKRAWVRTSRSIVGGR